MSAPSWKQLWFTSGARQWMSMGAVLALASGCASQPYTYRQDTYTPSGTYQVGKPYQVAGTWYHPKEDWDYDQTGLASWYGDEFHGRRTANGEVFDMHALTAAHPTLPMPTQVRVTNLENGRSIIVRINDRGPFKEDRIIDLSKRAAQELGFDRKGSAQVRVTMLGKAHLGRTSEAPPPNVKPDELQAPPPVVSPDGTAPVEPVVAEPIALYRSLRNPTGYRGGPVEPLPVLGQGGVDRRRYATTEGLMAGTVAPSQPPQAPASLQPATTQPAAPAEPPPITPQPSQQTPAQADTGPVLTPDGAERRRRFKVWPPTRDRYTPPPQEARRQPGAVATRAPSVDRGSLTVRDWPLGTPAAQPVQAQQQVQTAAAQPDPNFRPYFVQVGAYGVKVNAETQVALIRSDLNPVLGTPEIRETRRFGSTLYRVVVGPVRSKADGEELKRRLAALGFRNSSQVRN